MIRISNVKIGTKLGAALGLCALLLGGMLTAQHVSDSVVGEALGAAERQAKVQTNSIEVKASTRGMQVALRDLRLAISAEQVQGAEETFKARYAAVHRWADGALALVVSQDNRDRLNKIKGDAGIYEAGFREIKAAKDQVVAVRGNARSLAELSPTDQDRIQRLNFEIERVAKEKTLPTAQRMERNTVEIGEDVEKRAKIANDNLAQIRATAKYVQTLIGVVAGVILIGTIVFVMISIVRPLRGLVKPIEELSRGNFAVSMQTDGRKDEVGQIAEAVRAMAEKVRQTISEVKQSAREVTNASAEISTSTTDLSQRTEEQAASLEETSASMEEISATVKKNAENAQQANASAAQTREVADRGGEVVAKAVDAMARIEESSRKISDIITVIDEIARQTNLLALNAAVEAARAGEAGRGFAVVASEVRSLAQRSSQAAKDIKDLITNSNSQVKDGVELVNQAGAALNEIVESIKQVAAVVNEIANASLEQASGIEQVNKALTQMDEVTQQNSALVEENAATAKTLEHQAKTMDEQVAFFRIDMAAGAEGLTHAGTVAVKPVVGKPHAARVEAQPVVRGAAPSVAPNRAAAGGARKLQANLATAIKTDPEWEEF
jgi:methyl-accepting chemotaxis protein